MSLFFSIIHAIKMIVHVKPFHHPVTESREYRQGHLRSMYYSCGVITHHFSLNEAIRLYEYIKFQVIILKQIPGKKGRVNIRDHSIFHSESSLIISTSKRSSGYTGMAMGMAETVLYSRENKARFRKYEKFSLKIIDAKKANIFNNKKK